MIAHPRGTLPRAKTPQTPTGTGGAEEADVEAEAEAGVAEAGADTKAVLLSELS